VTPGARQPGAAGAQVGSRARLNYADVRLLGYALDHAALLQLLNALQEFPDFQQVELVRATLEPHGAGVAVAFELACRTMEGRP
jgi:hypothetical protein